MTSRVIDVRLFADRNGRWLVRVEGRRAVRVDADRPGAALSALVKLLDVATRATQRPEAAELCDAHSALYEAPPTRAGELVQLLRARPNPGGDAA